jgi:hypothetical protein
LERGAHRKLAQINQFIVSQNSVPEFMAHAGRKASSISMEWWTKGSR